MSTQSPGARRRVWITGIVFLAFIAGLAVLSARAAIESELESRAADKLAEAGYSWLGISVSGRDVTLQGAVFSEQDREHAIDALRGIWGIGRIESRLKVAVREQPYKISLSRSDDELTLRGSVPDEETRKTIVGLINANFPGFDTSTDLKIDPGMAETERWLTGVGFALSQLKNVSSGRSLLADAELSFEGRAAKPGAYEALMRGFREETPSGISVTQLRVSPPKAEPFTWKIQRDDDNIILGGHAPSELAQASIVAIAQQLFPDAKVIDRTVIANGEPEGWWRAARTALEALNHLRSGSVTLARAEITMEGVAKNWAAQRAISALKDAWPSGFEFQASVRFSRWRPSTFTPKEANAGRQPRAQL